ncbi:Vitellinogen superhelical [Trinorchestia longiramus]|nr:Vitellinogen superhelical [Trinorchestia longiramus]
MSPQRHPKERWGEAVHWLTSFGSRSTLALVVLFSAFVNSARSAQIQSASCNGVDNFSTRCDLPLKNCEDSGLDHLPLGTEYVLSLVTEWSVLPLNDSTSNNLDAVEDGAGGKNSQVVKVTKLTPCLLKVDFALSRAGSYLVGIAKRQVVAVCMEKPAANQLQEPAAEQLQEPAEVTTLMSAVTQALVSVAELRLDAELVVSEGVPGLGLCPVSYTATHTQRPAASQRPPVTKVLKTVDLRQCRPDTGVLSLHASQASLSCAMYFMHPGKDTLRRPAHENEMDSQSSLTDITLLNLKATTCQQRLVVGSTVQSSKVAVVVRQVSDAPLTTVNYEELVAISIDLEESEADAPFAVQDDKKTKTRLQSKLKKLCPKRPSVLSRNQETMLTDELGVVYSEVVSLMDSLAEPESIIALYGQIRADEFCKETVGSRRVRSLFVSALRDSFSPAAAAAVCRLVVHEEGRMTGTRGWFSEDDFQTSLPWSTVLAHKLPPSWDEALHCSKLLETPQWQTHVLGVMPLIRKSLHQNCDDLKVLASHRLQPRNSCVLDHFLSLGNNSRTSRFSPHASFHGHSQFSWNDWPGPDLTLQKISQLISEYEEQFLETAEDRDPFTRETFGSCSDGIYRVMEILTKKLQNCMSSDENGDREILSALVGLKSLGVLTKEVESSVLRCISNQEDAPDAAVLKISAIETLSVQPCSVRSALALLRLLYSREETAEVRAASYRGLLVCDPHLAARISQELQQIDDPNVLSYIKSYGESLEQNPHPVSTSPLSRLFMEVSQRIQLYLPSLLGQYAPSNTGFQDHLDILHLIDALKQNLEAGVDIIYDGSFLPRKIVVDLMGKFWQRFGKNLEARLAHIFIHYLAPPDMAYIGLRMDNLEGLVKSLLQMRSSTTAPSPAWQMKLLEILHDTILNFIEEFTKENFSDAQNSDGTSKTDDKFQTMSDDTINNFPSNSTDNLEPFSADTTKTNSRSSRTRRGFSFSDLRDLLISLFNSQEASPTAMWLWLQNGKDTKWHQKFTFTVKTIRTSLREWMERNAETALRAVLNNEEVVFTHSVPLSQLHSKLHPIAGPPLIIRSREGFIIDGRVQAGLHLVEAVMDGSHKVSGAIQLSASSYRHMTVSTEVPSNSIWRTATDGATVWSSSDQRPTHVSLNTDFDLTLENPTSFSLTLSHRHYNMPALVAYMGSVSTTGPILHSSLDHEGFGLEEAHPMEEFCHPEVARTVGIESCEFQSFYTKKIASLTHSFSVTGVSVGGSEGTDEHVLTASFKNPAQNSMFLDASVTATEARSPPRNLHVILGASSDQQNLDMRLDVMSHNFSLTYQCE